jgi:hypothetical protein
VKKAMTRTKNRTCYVLRESIVPQRVAVSNELVDLTDANLQLIKKTPSIQYDLGPTGILQIGLRERGKLVFDINTLDEDGVDLLINACLNNKTVVGYDLYKSFTFTRLRTERWKPQISLDISSLMRTFNCFAPLVEGMTGFEHLILMTRTTSFFDAVVQMLDWDAFLSVYERMPWIIAGLCSDAIRAMEFEGSQYLTAGRHYIVDFSKEITRPMSPAQAARLGLNPYYLSSVNEEFWIAVENMRDILGLRGK